MDHGLPAVAPRSLALRRIRGDVPKVLEVLGAGLPVAGIVLILAPRLALTERAVNARLIGDTLAVCAVLLTACDANLYRRMAKNDAAPEPSSVTFMTFVSGSTILLALMSLIPAPIPADAFRGSSLLLLVALSILCTAIPSFVFAFASKRLPPVVTATISLLLPLFAGAFAYLTLGEKVPLTAIPGSAFVLAGIVMILRGRYIGADPCSSLSERPLSRSGESRCRRAANRRVRLHPGGPSNGFAHGSLENSGVPHRDYEVQREPDQCKSRARERGSHADNRDDLPERQASDRNAQA